MNSQIESARLAILDFIIDTLTDLADPSADEVGEIRDNMMHVAEILIEGMGLTITEVLDDGSVVASLSVGTAA